MIDIVLPIFLVILVGFVFAKKEKFSAQSEQLINSYVLNVALPTLLFLAVAQANFHDLLQWEFLIASLSGIVFAYLLGLIYAWYMGVKSPKSAIIAMASCYGTTGYMGIPLVIVAFGTVATLPAALATILHNIPAILAVIITYEVMGENKKHSKLKLLNIAFVAIIKNPLSLSVLIGLLFSMFSLTLPSAIVNFLKFVGVAAGPTALFAIGVGLARLENKKYFKIKTLALLFPIVFIKIVLQPFIAFVVGFYLLGVGVDDIYFKVAIIMSALPVGAGVYVFANQYNYYQKESSVAIIMSLLITMGTLSFLLEVV